MSRILKYVWIVIIGFSVLSCAHSRIRFGPKHKYSKNINAVEDLKTLPDYIEVTNQTQFQNKEIVDIVAEDDEMINSPRKDENPVIQQFTESSTPVEVKMVRATNALVFNESQKEEDKRNSSTIPVMAILLVCIGLLVYVALFSTVISKTALAIIGILVLAMLIIWLIIVSSNGDEGAKQKNQEAEKQPEEEKSPKEKETIKKRSRILVPLLFIIPIIALILLS